MIKGMSEDATKARKRRDGTGPCVAEASGFKQIRDEENVSMRTDP